MVEAVAQTLGPEEPQAGGGELQRERQPIEAPANLGDDISMLGGVEVRAHRLRARREQRDGVVDRRADRRHRDARRRSAADVRLVTRIRSSGHAAPTRQHLARRRRSARGCRGRAAPSGRRRARRCRRERALLGLFHVERRREGGRKLARIGDIGETDERRAVGKLRSKQRGPSSVDKARLPDSARPRRSSRPGARARGRRARRARARGRGARCSARGSGARIATIVSPFPSSSARSGTTRPSAGDRVEVERPADVLEPERAERR